MTVQRAERRAVLRRLASLAAVPVLAACDRLSNAGWFVGVLGSAERLNGGLHHALTGRRSMAQEFGEPDISPTFPGSGTIDPQEPEYRRFAAAGFVDWRLEVGGLVARPARFSLADLRAMPSRTQITRHDCVDGWSAIGKWTGVPLSEVLARVEVTTAARFVVFRCLDDRYGRGQRYYESIDMNDALHPQTMLAHALNDAPLPVANGAPLRLRVERQLGYKMPKYLARIELVADFASIGGKGGTYEDRGYAWYAGI
jgi:DMSO/TMAO reductase YedYZ molybdopterin-dependent catalytic subunit